MMFFQSAFHRGSGCYSEMFLKWALICLRFFQSAFHRGSGCYYRITLQDSEAFAAFSPLFIAAVVVTRDYSADGCVIDTSFSPLFIAAVVVTHRTGAHRDKRHTFQSAFHRGSGCYGYEGRGNQETRSFQSAFHRGSGCYLFSQRCIFQLDTFQSAFHRGSGCYN